MTFTTLGFAFFLPVVFLLYWFVFEKNFKTQNLLLLLSSLVFYCIADWKFLFLLAASGLINFYLALSIAKKDEGRNRRLLFYLGLVFNIGMLIYFKYFNFFIGSFIKLLNFGGADLSFTPLHILLPLGISFYTFQMIGYLIDINNEEIQPTGDILSFFTYLAYFPKILSGPIERIQQFLPQIRIKREFTFELAADGVRQFLWGLFKKLVIADRLVPVADSIFNNYHNLNGSTLLLGAVFYIVGLYADFSGYSDMACGVSKLFGIRITNNFAYPFFSTNISEFWKKWHISLTSWLMDYVFTPLNFLFRGYKKAGLVLAIIVTFLLVGIWHGANWTFIVFGFIQGLYFVPLIIMGTMNKSKDSAPLSIGRSMKDTFQMTGLFILISLTSILFKAENVDQAFNYISQVLSASLFSLPTIPEEQKTVITLVFIGICALMEWMARGYEHPLAYFEVKWKRPLRSVLYLTMVLAIIWFGGKQQQFIYFQF